MEIVKIRKINEAFMKIEADQGVMRDISEHFTFFADSNCQAGHFEFNYMPAQIFSAMTSRYLS